MDPNQLAICVDSGDLWLVTILPPPPIPQLEPDGNHPQGTTKETKRKRGKTAGRALKKPCFSLPTPSPPSIRRKVLPVWLSSLFRTRSGQTGCSKGETPGRGGWGNGGERGERGNVEKDAINNGRTSENTNTNTHTKVESKRTSVAGRGTERPPPARRWGQ